MSLDNSQLLFAGDTGVVDSYKIQNSTRFAASQSGSAERTPASSSSTTTWTFAAWVKRGSLTNSITFFGAKTGSNFTALYFSPTSLVIRNVPVGGTSTNGQASTTMQFNDPSAWYHLVVVWDTTNETSTDRIRIYVNGVRADVNLTSTPSLNAASVINTNQKHELGKELGVFSYNDLYLADVYFIDGQALSASSFGFFHSVTKSWRPKPYAGTYGTNGFFLNFSDTSSGTTSSNVGIGKDFSGNGNYWITNLSVNPSDIGYAAFKDVPTLTSTTAANYPVANPLGTNSSFATVPNFIFSNANLTLTNNSNNNRTSFASMELPRIGKWYWESTYASALAGVNFTGVALTSEGTPNANGAANMYSYYVDGTKWIDGTNSAYGSAYTGAVTIAFTYDSSTGVLTAYRNNVSQGTMTTLDTTKGYTPTWGANNTASTYSIHVNFGQRPFTYTPPAGFVGLNSFNLTAPTIPQGNKYMDATLWTGDDSAQTITNAGAFKPDLVWWKNRNSTRNHLVFDSIRGAGNYIQTNSIAAEATDAQMLTSFNSNGFTHGTAANGAANAETYVGWQWQAGQGSTSSNTNGSITSTVSVNASAGFSIVTYTGTGANATVGHGLGVAPKMIFVKARNNANGWIVWHTSLTSGAYFLDLQGTAAQTLGTDVFQSTIPNSTVVTLGTNVNTNRSAGTFVLYSWAEIEGFSKFGSYTGNGSTDGTFVYLGFIPKFILIKNITTAGLDWTIFDSSRNTYNVTNLKIAPNTSAVEVVSTSTSTMIDILSNGFKLRGTGDGGNRSGNTIIYMAFAENPFKYSNAR